MLPLPRTQAKAKAEKAAKAKAKAPVVSEPGAASAAKKKARMRSVLRVRPSSRCSRGPAFSAVPASAASRYGRLVLQPADSLAQTAAG
jgi:hypothetical protein